MIWICCAGNAFNLSQPCDSKLDLSFNDIWLFVCLIQSRLQTHSTTTNSILLRFFILFFPDLNNKARLFLFFLGHFMFRRSHSALSCRIGPAAVLAYEWEKCPTAPVDSLLSDGAFTVLDLLRATEHQKRTLPRPLAVLWKAKKAETKGNLIAVFQNHFRQCELSSVFLT